MEGKIHIKPFLEKNFGLSAREIEIYLSLLKNGPSSILEISTYTGMNRGTVHFNIEALNKKGLTGQIGKGRGSKRAIFAEPSQKLSLLLKQKKENIELAEKQIGDIEETMNALISHKKEAGATTNIRVCRGKHEINSLYDEVLQARELRAYVNCKKLKKTLPHNFEKFAVAINNKNIKIWEILDDSVAAKDYANKMAHKNHHYKITKKDANLSMIDYMMFDGKIAIVDLGTGQTGTVIDNQSFYNNSKAIFELVWEHL